MSDTGNLVYNRQVALILGICGVMIGVLCIFVQIPAYTEEYEFWSLFSPGIWTAVFFIITGAVTIASWKTAANSCIIAVMVLSILSCLVAFGGIIIYMMFWIIDGAITYGLTGHKYKVAMSISTIHLLLFLVEVVLTIVMSAFCCRAVCCGPPQELAVVYVPTPESPGPNRYGAPGDLRRAKDAPII